MAHGYLLIADISGYTAFLTGSELDHAQDIMKHLIETVLKHLKPPVVVSKLEGDAIFCYVHEGSFLMPQTLLEIIENIYVEFSRARQLMHLNTTCTCNACRNIPILDLKFVLHHGEFLVQNIGGREELSGACVILVHRLLKNEIVEKTGIKAYVFLTDACTKTMKLSDITATMQPHAETYEHLGIVNGFTYDVAALAEQRKDQHRIMVQEDDVSFDVEYELPVPPPLAWDYFNDDECRKYYTKSSRVSTAGKRNGRAGVGTTFHCYHGQDDTQMVVVDWQPFDYFTLRVIPAVPLKLEVLSSTHLTPTATGTKVVERYATPVFASAFGKVLGTLLWYAGLRYLIRKEVTAGAVLMTDIIVQHLDEGKITTTLPT